MRLWIRAHSAFGSVVRIVNVSSPGESWTASFALHQSLSPAIALHDLGIHWLQGRFTHTHTHTHTLTRQPSPYSIPPIKVLVKERGGLLHARALAVSLSADR
jgi:hypothetical protein